MTAVLIDTDVLLDYLRGDVRAAEALASYPERAISVVTWLELMVQCPPSLTERTRGFLRSFERLSVNEAIADAALELSRCHPVLSRERALTWATARLNRLTFLTTSQTVFAGGEADVIVAYCRE